MLQIAHVEHLLVKLKVGYVEPAETDEMAHLSESIALSGSAWGSHGMPVIHDPGCPVVTFTSDVTMHGL